MVTNVFQLLETSNHNNVDFGYVPGVRILKDINVWAEPGLKVAFVGATGAGKTTITNLINRFYEIDSGSLLSMRFQ